MPHWKRLAPLLVELATVRRADLPALELLAECLASADAARLAIEAEGTTIAAGSGGRKAHPALAMLGNSRAQAVGLLDRFGLNPVARQKVETVGVFKGGKFAGLLGGQDDPAERFFARRDERDARGGSNPSRRPQ